MAKTNMEIVREALEACEEFLDNRGDVNWDGTAPNEELKLLQVVRGGLAVMEKAEPAKDERSEAYSNAPNIDDLLGALIDIRFIIETLPERFEATFKAGRDYQIVEMEPTLASVRNAILGLLPADAGGDELKAKIIHRLDKVKVEGIHIGAYPELLAAAEFANTALEAIKGAEADYDEQLPDDHEIGCIEESRRSPSFRIRVGHIRQLAAALAKAEVRI